MLTQYKSNILCYASIFLKMVNLEEIVQNPKQSIFISANAGCGKTTILTKRVVALLSKGVEVRKILCISFTEAACKELIERIEKELILYPEIYSETVLKNNLPKVVTFHSFCMEVIRSFSYESGFLYRPSVLTASKQKLIKQEIFKNLFLKDSTKFLIKEIKFAFSNYIIQNKILPEILKLKNCPAIEEIYNKLEVQYFTENIRDKVKDVEEKFLRTFPFNLYEQLVNCFLKTDPTDKKLSKLQKAQEEKSSANLIEALLTKEKKQSLRFITKKNEEVREIYEILCNALISFIDVQNRIITAKITENIIKIESEINAEYQKQKQTLAVVDFEDLIEITKTTLESENRDFILFKLDGGIEHILVDEAQDTNFTQWSILFNIIEEFFSGEGRNEKPKSLFVVGDEKQSIFRFQGAEPEVFEFVKNKYAESFTFLYLAKSYRSSCVILNLVDEIFTDSAYQISSLPYQKHEANFDIYGKIEVMPLLAKPLKQKVANEIWKMPWEENEEEGLKDLIANQITGKILEILETKRALPKDIMLLSKSRDFILFSKIKLILKKYNIEVCFKDNILLSESMIINDFISILKFLLNPNQQLSLAIILKSPIFCLSDNEFEEFFLQKKEAPIEILNLKNLLTAGLEEFFTTLFARFGKFYENEEIKEGVHIFNLIKEYEGNSFEGFINFVEELKSMNYSFKIEFAAQSSNVIISTVHASKGLESKIIFLLNATEVLSRESAKENIVFNKKKDIFLVSGKKYETDLWNHFKEEEKKEEYTEYLRLLYVAITRAKHELYVFGKEQKKDESEFESWYSIILNKLRIHEYGKYEAMQVMCEKVNETIIVNNDENYIHQNTAEIVYGKDADKIMQMGSLVHFFLEHEIKEIDPELTKFLELKFNLINAQDIKEAFEISIQTKQNFPELFLESTYSEVEVLNEKEGEVSLLKIDKLLVKENEIQIIDFKFYNNEEIDSKILNQLKAYHKSIAKIYPAKTIKCFILWLKSQTLKPIEVDFV